jgi:hypothetical protein
MAEDMNVQARETGQGLSRAGTARQATITRRGCLLGRAAHLAAATPFRAAAAPFRSSAGGGIAARSTELGARCADGRPLSSLTARLALAFALVLAGAFPAGAETWSAGRGQSSVELRATQAPGAVAEVMFQNSTGDGGGRVTHEWSLTRNGLTIRGEVDLGLGDPDTIRVTVPDAFIAVPDVETIPDGTTAVIVIYPLHAVGM